MTHYSSVCTLTDRVRLTGTVLIEAADANERPPTRTRQRFRGTVTVALPTVGPMVERIIVATIKRSYEKLPAVLEQWVQACAATLQ